MTKEFDQWRDDVCKTMPPPFVDFRPIAIPPFLRSKLTQWAKHRGLRNPGVSKDYWAEHLLREALGIGVVDHYGSATTLDGRPCFITQPYGGPGLKALLACEMLASAIGVECEIHGPSQWYPGKTVSILFSEPAD